MLKDQESDSEDPLQAVSSDSQEFAFYQKNISQNYKSRAQKNKERVQRITRRFVDPQLKKQTRQQQKQAEKAKLHRLIESMTEAEARAYLDERKARRAEEKERVRAAMGSGQVFMVDLVFEQKMNEKENKSLGKQIELIMRVIKQFQQPPSIHLCSFGGSLRQQMEKRNYHFWALTAHAEDVKTTAQLLGKNPIYLSPEAELPLERVEADTAFILGGLIDRTIIKYATYHRANHLGIEARHLPIAHLMKGRACLNLDHVVAMVAKFKETGDWEVAFNYAAPKRWKKQQPKQKQQGEKQQLEEDQQGGKDGDSEEEREEEVREKEQKQEVIMMMGC